MGRVGHNLTECDMLRRSSPGDGMSHPQNRKYLTYRNTVSEGPSHGQRQHAENLVKFGVVVFALRQTDMIITILCTRCGDEAIMQFSPKPIRECLSRTRRHDKKLEKSAVVSTCRLTPADDLIALSPVISTFDLIISGPMLAEGLPW